MAKDGYNYISATAVQERADDEKARLAKVLPAIQSSIDDVVIVCPRGGGARNTVNHFKSRGVAQERLLILRKGVDNWPYETRSRPIEEGEPPSGKI